MDVKIFREMQIRHPLYVSVLENNVVIEVYDGYAQDNQGNKYISVYNDTNNDEIEFIGWQIQED